jgi:ribosomal protein S18 acetylase RimI-like enzyme
MDDNNRRMDWMFREVLDEVVGIESLAHKDNVPWERDDFLYELSKPRCYGTVFSEGDQLLGYTVYQIEDPALNGVEYPIMNIVNLAVDVDYQRQGIGKEMLDTFYERISVSNGDVRESRVNVLRENSVAQGFFRSQGYEEYTELDFVSSGSEGKLEIPFDFLRRWLD